MEHCIMQACIMEHCIMETCIIEHRIMQACIMEHCFIHKLAFFMLWSQKFLLWVQFLLIGYKFQYSSDAFAASLKCITYQEKVNS